ncbi:MAG: hypothetical protein KDK08_13035 [Rhizobiaceae bacterium]|nr:hypothetical protein [Rhizobiaceae bacterium]
MFKIDVPPHFKDQRTCIMPICGCIDAMHGKAFKALVAATAEHFRCVEIILCDTLDAHNFAFPGDDLWPTAMEACTADADRWLRKSKPILEAAFARVDVTHWDELKGAEFDRVSHTVQELYAKNPEVRDYIHGICADYTERAAVRQEAKGFIPDRQRIFARSLNYTLEEMPGTVIYNRLFAAPVIYVGAYFDDPHFLNRHAPGSEDLTLPEWCRVSEFARETLAA